MWTIGRIKYLRIKNLKLCKIELGSATVAQIKSFLLSTNQCHLVSHFVV